MPHNYKIDLAPIVSRQLPEFVREDYPTFVAFVQAYYEFLKTQDYDLFQTRDIDRTLDDFLIYFKQELAYNAPYLFKDQRFYMQKIKDAYLAKGSEASYKLLFKLLFDKEVLVKYPGKSVLRASDGKWNQDISIFVKVNYGDINDIIGRLVTIESAQRILRVTVSKKQEIESEIERVVALGDNIYEVFLEKRFYGKISPGNTLKYEDSFLATVLSTTSNVNVLVPGKGFRIGQVFKVQSSTGTQSLVKITRVDPDGGILNAQLIKFGIGYLADFATTVYPSNSVVSTSSATPNLTQFTRIGPIVSNFQNKIENGTITTSTGTTLVTGVNTNFYQNGTYTDKDGNTQIYPGVIPGDILKTAAGVTIGTVQNVVGTSNTQLILTSNAAVSVTGSSFRIFRNYKAIASITDTPLLFNEVGFINYSNYVDTLSSAGIRQGTISTSTSSAIVTGTGTSFLSGVIAPKIQEEDVLKDEDGNIIGSVKSIDSNTQITLYQKAKISLTNSPYEVFSSYVDGTYAGTLIKEYSVNSVIETGATEPATIEVKLDGVAKYPGYFESNDSFVSDSIFIQDSKYYQTFSYVLAISERLESYKSVVKTLLHPAGLAMYGEYDLINNFDLAVELESILKLFNINVRDDITIGTDDLNKNVFKYVQNHLLADELTNDHNSVSESDYLRFITNGVPGYIAGVNKPINDTAYSRNVVPATNLVAGTQYTITSLGTTNFTLVGASANEIGIIFTATGPGTGTGSVTSDEFITFGFNKRITDTATLTDAITIGYMYFDSATATDSLSREFKPNYADTVDFANGITEIFRINNYIQARFAVDYAITSNTGYVVLNAYEEGDYFSEVYANARDATISN